MNTAINPPDRMRDFCIDINISDPLSIETPSRRQRFRRIRPRLSTSLNLVTNTNKPPRGPDNLQHQLHVLHSARCVHLGTKQMRGQQCLKSAKKIKPLVA